MILLGQATFLKYLSRSSGTISWILKGGTKTPSCYISHTCADLTCRLKLGTTAEIPQKGVSRVTIKPCRPNGHSCRQIAKSGETWGESSD